MMMNKLKLAVLAAADLLHHLDERANQRAARIMRRQPR